MIDACMGYAISSNALMQANLALMHVLGKTHPCYHQMREHSTSSVGIRIDWNGVPRYSERISLSSNYAVATLKDVRSLSLLAASPACSIATSRYAIYGELIVRASACSSGSLTYDVRGLATAMGRDGSTQRRECTEQQDRAASSSEKPDIPTCRPQLNSRRANSSAPNLFYISSDRAGVCNVELFISRAFHKLPQLQSQEGMVQGCRKLVAILFFHHRRCLSYHNSASSNEKLEMDTLLKNSIRTGAQCYDNRTTTRSHMGFKLHVRLDPPISSKQRAEPRNLSNSIMKLSSCQRQSLHSRMGLCVHLSWLLILSR